MLKPSRLRLIANILSIIVLINLCLSGTVAQQIGGDSLGVSPQNGHYYVSEKGKLTEVSYPVYLYSKILSLSVIITSLLLVLLIFYFWKKGISWR
jgi:hypothetical protein